MKTIEIALAAMVVAAIGFGGNVEAALFKCTAADGTVMYQTKPCDPSLRQESAQGTAGAPGPSRESAPLAPVIDAPATKKSDGRVVVAPSDQAIAQNRAVADREAAQKRDRCASYRSNIDGQRAILAEPKTTATARKKATDEIAIQERRRKEDGCE
ncbi:MAG: hypothetical protein U1F51_17260 [Burkholderiales bacterium]